MKRFQEIMKEFTATLNRIALELAGIDKKGVISILGWLTELLTQAMPADF
jgi:hypothetical protein